MSDPGNNSGGGATETILGALDSRALCDPGGTALRCEDRSGTRELRWPELADKVRRLAAGWRALGVREGDPVLIIMPNSPELLAAQLGVIAAGGVAASVDPAHSRRFMRPTLSSLSFRFCLIGGGDCVSVMDSPVLADLRCLVHQAPLPRAAECERITLERLETMGQNGVRELPGTDAAKTCLSAFTMGSTGFPFPVALSQSALLAAGLGLVETLGLRAGDAYLSLSHLSSSWTLQEFLACMWSGAALSLMEWCPGLGSLEKTAGRLSPVFVRMSHAVFTEMFAQCLRAVRFSGRRTPLSLRLGSAAADLLAGRGRKAWRAVQSRARRREIIIGSRSTKILLSCGTLSQRDLDAAKDLVNPVLHTYGLTEACGFLSVGRGGTRTQGRPIAGMRLDVDNGGEIKVSGPAVMNGYLGVPAGDTGPRCEIRDGELLTRDFGRLDADGELRYERGARYQYYPEGGEPVPCDRVAELIMEDPLVLRAAVIGGKRHGLNLKYLVAMVTPDPEAMNAVAGPPKGLPERRARWEALGSRLRIRLDVLPPEQRPREFLFSSRRSSSAWKGKRCPDHRLIYPLIHQPRDNFDLLYLQLRDNGKRQPAAGTAPRKCGEPVFLSVESEFDRTLVRSGESGRDYGFRPDKVLGAGIPFLMGALEHAGWDPDYLPYRFQWTRNIEMQVRKLVSLLSQRQGRIIAAGCASISLPFVLAALKEVCRLDPGRKVVLGGCGPSSAARSIIANFPFVDAVILGEAELSLPRVLEALSSGGDLSRIPGITARAPDGSVVAGVPERIRDLDALPLPSYGRIDLSLYHHAGVSTMRGCPNQCKFCGNRAMYGPGVSLRSMDRVMDELRMLYYELGQREFSVADDTFTLLKPRVLEFCSRMRGEFGRKFNWYCFASVDSLDAERMKAMAGAGCRSMFVGVESGSDRMLRLYKEAGDYTAAQAVAKLAEASEYFPTVLAAIIVGFPKEGLYDFLQTLRMVDVILKRGYGKVAIQSLKAIPLTPLFEQNRDKFIIPPTVGSYIGSREYGEWAKTFALMDPSLAPWAAQIPTPYPRLKELLMRHYLRRRRDLL